MNALDVVQSGADRLRGISVAAGYSVDIGEQVLILIDPISPADPRPLVSVLFEGEQGPAGGQRPGCPHVQMTGDFLVVGSVDVPEGYADTDAMRLIQDIKRALFGRNAQQALSAQGLTLEHTRSHLLPRQDGDAAVEVQVHFKATWSEDIAT